jgi:3-phosphoshikimate 1-carboxyvinyltransferase
MPAALVHPSLLHGTVQLPPSKSLTMRALTLAALAQGSSTIIDPLISPDTEAMVRVIKTFGAKVEHCSWGFRIEGMKNYQGCLTGSSVDVGNSGLALRFATALFSLCREPVVISGDLSIHELRPIEPLVDALQQLGASSSYLGKSGFAPLRIQGPIHSGQCVVEGADSQPVSALLVALSVVDGYSTIQVRHMGERPWVEMTLSVLKDLGVSIDRLASDSFGIQGPQHWTGFCRKIPKDASSLAFPLVAGVTANADLLIQGVSFNDVQNDMVIIDFVRKMGGVIECGNDWIHVRGPQKLHGVDIDINEAVDAFPILAVLAAKAHGKTRIFNGAICRKKESDRIHAMAQELRQMGALIIEHDDGLTINGGTLHGAAVHCHADHRVAMALSVAALSAEGATKIYGVECVKKSFPQFFSLLKNLGSTVEVIS